MKKRIAIVVVLLGLLAIVFVPGPPQTALEIPSHPDRDPILIETAQPDTASVPLLVVLHGYRSNPWIQSIYLRLSDFVKQRPFRLAWLAGTEDADGSRFWNANPSCCNLDGAPVDDAAYIHAALQALKAKFPTSRTYLVGHSNGGFMAYRMLCQHPEDLDGIVSIAGMDSNPACADGFTNKTVLHVHGTADDVIPLTGGSFRGQAFFPGLNEQLDAWDERLGCGPDGRSDVRDYSLAIPGPDTDRTEYVCGRGNRLVVSVIRDGGHTPFFTGEFRIDLLELLLGKN